MGLLWFFCCLFLCYFSLLVCLTLDGHPYLSVNVSCSVFYVAMFHVLFFYWESRPLLTFVECNAKMWSTSRFHFYEPKVDDCNAIKLQLSYENLQCILDNKTIK